MIIATGAHRQSVFVSGRNASQEAHKRILVSDRGGPAVMLQFLVTLRLPLILVFFRMGNARERPFLSSSVSNRIHRAADDICLDHQNCIRKSALYPVSLSEGPFRRPDSKRIFTHQASTVFQYSVREVLVRRRVESVQSRAKNCNANTRGFDASRMSVGVTSTSKPTHNGKSASRRRFCRSLGHDLAIRCRFLGPDHRQALGGVHGFQTTTNIQYCRRIRDAAKARWKISIVTRYNADTRFDRSHEFFFARVPSPGDCVDGCPIRIQPFNGRR